MLVSCLSSQAERSVDKLCGTLQEAEELRRLKELNNVKFSQGKKAYSIGQYTASMLLFQEASQKEGEYSALGGEIQLWLALAFQVGQPSAGQC